MNVYRCSVKASNPERGVVALIVASDAQRALARALRVYGKSYPYSAVANVTIENLGVAVQG